MRLTSRLLSVTFFLVTAISACYASPAPEVYGTLLDSNSHALAGVTMTLTLTANGAVRVVTTNQSGYYEFLTQGSPFQIYHDYTLVPLLANYSFSPSSVSIFVPTGGPGISQAFTGSLGSLTASPLDTAEFFVRQQYVDLLKREPDESGLNFWATDLKACTTQSCRTEKRRNVMCAFIASGEYQSRFIGSSISVC